MAGESLSYDGAGWPLRGRRPLQFGRRVPAPKQGVVAPKALDKFDGDRLAVEIVLMVEQIDLD
jgi:hypothetical protein